MTNETDQANPDEMDVPELARVLNINPRTAHDMLDQGRLKVVREEERGTRTYRYVSRAEVEEYKARVEAEAKARRAKRQKPGTPES